MVIPLLRGHRLVGLSDRFLVAQPLDGPGVDGGPRLVDLQKRQRLGLVWGGRADDLPQDVGGATDGRSIKMPTIAFAS